MKKPWFGAKAYGIGIGPKGLPGWLTMLVYVAAMVGVATSGEWLHPPLWIVAALFFACTAGLVAVIALTSDGKPWRWRWGDR